LLLSSASVRAIPNIGAALASETKQDDNHISISKEDYIFETREELESIVSALQDRASFLDKKEDTLNARSRFLQEEERRIERERKRIIVAENKLRDVLALADNVSERDLKQLTAVYENMKPKDLAGLFQQMDPSFSAGFISRMRPEVAAQTLAGLTPEVAYSISAILAGRRHQAPDS